MLRVSSTEVGTKEFLRMLKQYESINLKELGEILNARALYEINVERKREIKSPEQRFRRRYTSHISDVLSVEPVVTSEYGVGVGIGNIAKLNKETPYWLVLNNGGYVPPETHGFFSGGNPQGGVGGDSAFTFSSKGPGMKPHKAMDAVNYIEKTIIWANKYVLKYVSDAIKTKLSSKVPHKK